MWIPLCIWSSRQFALAATVLATFDANHWSAMGLDWWPAAL